MTAAEMIRPPHRPVPFKQQGSEHFAQERPVLITEAEVDARFDELALQMVQDYGDNAPNIIALAKGALPSANILKAKLLKHGMKTEIFELKSRTRTRGIGEATVQRADITPPLYTMEFDLRAPVLVWDDVLDTGLTGVSVMKKVNSYFEHLPQRPEFGPKIEPRFAVMLNKVANDRPHPIEAHYAGFNIPYKFHWVEGIGLDTDEEGREGTSIIVRNDLQKVHDPEGFAQAYAEALEREAA